MDRYIKLEVQNGANIGLDLCADANNTPIKIVSGSQEYDISVGLHGQILLTMPQGRIL